MATVYASLLVYVEEDTTLLGTVERRSDNYYRIAKEFIVDAGDESRDPSSPYDNLDFFLLAILYKVREEETTEEFARLLCMTRLKFDEEADALANSNMEHWLTNEQFRWLARDIRRAMCEPHIAEDVLEPSAKRHLTQSSSIDLSLGSSQESRIYEHFPDLGSTQDTQLVHPDLDKSLEDLRSFRGEDDDTLPELVPTSQTTVVGVEHPEIEVGRLVKIRIGTGEDVEMRALTVIPTRWLFTTLDVRRDEGVLYLPNEFGPQFHRFEYYPLLLEGLVFHPQRRAEDEFSINGDNFLLHVHGGQLRLEPRPGEEPRLLVPGPPTADQLAFIREHVSRLVKELFLYDLRVLSAIMEDRYVDDTLVYYRNRVVADLVHIGSANVPRPTMVRARLVEAIRGFNVRGIVPFSYDEFPPPLPHTFPEEMVTYDKFIGPAPVDGPTVPFVQRVVAVYEKFEAVEIATEAFDEALVVAMEG